MQVEGAPLPRIEIPVRTRPDALSDPTALRWYHAYPIAWGLIVAAGLAVTHGFFQVHTDAGIIIGIVTATCTAFFIFACLPGLMSSNSYTACWRLFTISPFWVLLIGMFVSMLVRGKYCNKMDHDAANIHRAVYEPNPQNLSSLITANPSGLWVLNADLPDRAVFSTPVQTPGFIGFSIQGSAVVFVLHSDTPYPAMPFPIQPDGRLWLSRTPNEWLPVLYWIQQDLQTRFPAQNYTQFVTTTNALSQYHDSRSICEPSTTAFWVLAGIGYGWLVILQLCIVLFRKAPCRG